MGTVRRGKPDPGRVGTGKQETGLDDAAALLERAQQAVNAGDVVEMLGTLTASRYLDGLTRRLQSKWGRSLPWSEVESSPNEAASPEADREGEAVQLPAEQGGVGGGHE